MPQQSAISGVLAAVYTALNVSGMTALAPVYNDVPQGQAFPYVYITVSSETRMDAMQAPGKSVLVEVHAYSQYAGDLEAATLVSKAVELLHYQTLTVSSHTLIACQYEQTYDPGSTDVNGVKTRHLVALFRVEAMQA